MKTYQRLFPRRDHYAPRFRHHRVLAPTSAVARGAGVFLALLAALAALAWANDIHAQVTITCPPPFNNGQCASDVPTAATDASSFTGQGGTITGGQPPYSVSVNDFTTSGSCPNRFTINRTYTVTDSTNANDQCSQSITISDTMAPVISGCPPNPISLGCNPTPPTCDDAKALITVSDNCSGPITTNCVPGTPSQTGCSFSQTFTITATDGCNNTSDPCVVTYTWTVDTTPPTISGCPTATINLGCNPQPLPNCTTAQALIQVTDDCPGPITTNCVAGPIIPVLHSVGCNFSQTFTITAVDSCNNTSAPCAITYRWTDDTTPPQISGCPSAPIELPCNAAPPTCANALALISVFDSCPGITTNCAAGTPVQTGCRFTNTFTLTAVDSCNNTSAPCVVTYSWTVDTTRPDLTVPTTGLELGCATTAPANLPTDASVAALVQATDNCGALTTNVTHGVTNTVGCSNSVTFSVTATDACGNTTNKLVTYTWRIDNTPPTFTKVPPNQFLSCNPPTIPDCTSASNPNVIAAADNCGTPVISCQMSNFVSLDSCSHVRTLTFTATDCAGLTTNWVQQVFWTSDTTPPTFTTFPQDANLGCNPPGSIPGCNLGSVVAQDACSTPFVTCNVVNQTNGCNRTRLITYTATDFCGNSAQQTQTITWKVDNIVFSPQPFICGTNFNLGCNPDPASIESCHAFIHANSDCGGALVTCQITQTTNATSCVRTRVIVYTASDGCATNICSATNTWIDNTIKPTFINPPTPSTISLGCNATSIPGIDPAVTATNFCPKGTFSTLTYTTNDTASGCARSRVLTYRATDPCGNVQTVTRTYGWTVDTDTPVFTNCPPNMDLGCNPADIPGCDPAVGASDACSATVTCTSTNVVFPLGSCFNFRTNIYKAFDQCNHTSTCVQVVSWKVSTGPTLVGCPAPTMNLGCNPATIPGCADFNVTATGNCTPGGVTCSTNQPVTVTNGCQRTRTLTWIAADNCGSSTCQVAMTWTIDTDTPVFTKCPTNINLGCNPQTIPGCDTDPTNIVATDTCSVTITCASIPDVVDPQNTCIHYRTNTYTAFDQCNHTNTCTQVITWRIDTTNPTTIQCPPDTYASCGQADPAHTGTATGTDGCGAVIVTYSDSATAGVCPTNRIIIRTWKVTDLCSNFITCDQIITVTNSPSGPAFTNCPANINIGCNPSDTLLATYVCNTNVGADCAVTITCNQASDQTNGCVVQRTITYSAVDNCNTTSTCSYVVTWTVDFDPPTFILCPASVNLGCNPQIIPNCDTNSSNVAATDVCSTPVITCSRLDQTNACVATRRLTYKATDACGNFRSCVQTITWTIDTNAPVMVNCPAPTLHLGCNPDPANIPTTNTYAVNSADGCTPFPTITRSQVDGASGCLRTRTLKWVATDNCGNTNSCSQLIDWTVDTDTPVFTLCPGSVNLGCNPQIIPDCDTNSSNVQATDTCSTPVITCSKLDQTNACVATRRLTYKATDACGNFKTCVQTITWTIDTNAPVMVNCPTPTLHLGCNPASIPSTNTYAVNAADGCTPFPTITRSQVDTTSGCFYTRTLKWVATDNCGNTNSCSQFIDWTVDTVPPTLTVPPGGDLGCNPQNLPSDASVLALVTATDNCTVTTNISHTSVVTSGCTNSQTFTVVAADGCNSVTNTVTYTWKINNVLPTITCPPDFVTTCGNTNPSTTGTPTAQGDCASTFTFTDLITTGTCPTNYIIARHWTATDSCTNSVSCDQTIWVTDTTGPVFTNCTPVINLGCNPQTIPGCDPAVGAKSDCGLTLGCVTSSEAVSGCAHYRTNTYTATDSCGQSSTCVQLVTWTVDTTPPTLNNCPAPTLDKGCNPSQASIPTTNTYAVTATDGCGGAVIIYKKQVDSTNGCDFTRVITYTGVDSCNNTSAPCSQVVTWRRDTTLPTFTKCPASIDLGCNPQNIPDCDLSPNNVFATNICGVASITCDHVDQSSGCFYSRTIVYTAHSVCGNTRSCIQAISWTVDTTPPVLSGCPAPTLALGCNPSASSIPKTNTYNVTATDDCGALTLYKSQVDSTTGCLHHRLITYTAVDGCHNTNSCSQDVSWTVDNNQPTFSKCPASIDLGCNPQTIPDCDLSPSNVAATNDCGAATITCNKVDQASGCFHSRTLVYTAHSVCGNTRSCIQAVSWVVDLPPTFTNCPANVDLGTNPQSIPGCDPAVGATDDCGATPTVTCNSVNATNGCTYYRTNTYTATGGCGLSTTCTQVVTWQIPDPAPTLNVTLSGSNIVICWPVTCATWYLEQTTSLNSPITWTRVLTPPVVAGGQNCVTLPYNGNAYFRLCSGPTCP